MLHIKTVEPHTLSILNDLMEIDELSESALVGGTALSLKFGHRISTDLDLFFSNKQSNEEIIRAVTSKFGTRFTVRNPTIKIGVFGFIDGVKVDFVRYNHPIIFPIELHNKIRMYSNQDICAMKVQAILGRANKKDFWDIFELIQHYTIEQILEFHKLKYPSQILAIGIHYALNHFEDANESEDPVSLKGQTWDQVKRDISQAVNEYLK
jgi:predicted nucleotidyltransferase component of viral defense system